ncbi:MAG TPA: LuxR C-terminal-related transcriptional regulator [Anaerolineae bacterium]
MASPLILTKLSVPAPRPRTVPRTRVFARLGSESGTALVLVCAPAGYGKTTVLADWARILRQSGTPVAWYALDASDDGPHPFGSYLVASLVQALGATPELVNVAQMLRAAPEIDLPRTLSALINAVTVSDRECVLILDDYHLIAAPAVHSAVAFLIEHLPENLHIVIGSRSDPPLPLARLRVRGQLLEIRAADLRFSADETALFLNEMMRLALSPALVKALEDRTEGWIAGLQLAALSLTGRSDIESFVAGFNGRHRYLVDYLLDEVVGRQSVEVQRFLLSTSILERLCGPLCDAVLDNAGSDLPSAGEAVLERLDQDNLFVVALDDQAYWYRYHHLFRDFLLARLQKTQPARVASLHRAAAEWHSTRGFLREAVRHALATGDWDYAAAMVERHSFTMIMHSEISTIYEWCATFPEEVMRTHPFLCIHQSWALVLGARRQNQPRVEERLRQVEQAASALALTDRQAAEALVDHAATIRSYLTMTPDPAIDPQAHLALARKRLASYPENDAAQFSTLLTIGYAHLALQDVAAARPALGAARRLALREPLYYGIIETTYELARLSLSQGQLQHAAEICRRGQADLAAMLCPSLRIEQSMAYIEKELPALGCLEIVVGCVLMEQDRLDEAERHLLHGLAVIGWAGIPYSQMAACVSLYRLREIQGRAAEARAYLARLDETWPDIAFCTRGLRIQLALRTAPADPEVLGEAAVWCQEFSASVGEDLPSFGMGPLGAADAYYLASLAWARAQIAIGNPQAPLPYLERQLALATTQGLVERVIELSLLEALAGNAEGDEARTWAALERALIAARPEGHVRIFDHGPALPRLLRQAALHGICRSDVGRILATIDPPEDSRGARTADGGPADDAAQLAQAADLGPDEPLSDREREVLRLIARGASNREIADQLVITLGTVKSHINHILGKLGARNRTEAVARARAFGLLEF